jgi:hypothetical protein
MDYEGTAKRDAIEDTPALFFNTAINSYAFCVFSYSN